jgi:hypothetical protein
MDWARAIERNSEALKGIVAALFAMLGLAGEATRLRIPQPLHRAMLRVLRPAESAVRRLVVIAARGLVVKLAPSRPMPAGPIGQGGGSRRPSFQLFDTRKKLRVPAPTPQKAHAAFPAHPFLWKRSPGGSPVDITSACGRSRSAARWPRGRRTPHPEAPGPQARARGSAAPGQASRALAVEARERAKSEVQVAAQAGPSSRLPPEAGSRSR